MSGKEKTHPLRHWQSNEEILFRTGRQGFQHFIEEHTAGSRAEMRSYWTGTTFFWERPGKTAGLLLYPPCSWDGSLGRHRSPKGGQRRGKGGRWTRTTGNQSTAFCFDRDIDFIVSILSSGVSLSKISKPSERDTRL